MIGGALRAPYIGNYLSIYGCGPYLISTLSSVAPYIGCDLDLRWSSISGGRRRLTAKFGEYCRLQRFGEATAKNAMHIACGIGMFQ